MHLSRHENKNSSANIYTENEVSTCLRRDTDSFQIKISIIISRKRRIYYPSPSAAIIYLKRRNLL